MAPLDVHKPFTPPCTLSSSLTSTCDTSSSSSDDDSSAPLVPRSRCMHPGRRLIGGRIYDSVLGVTCHWCRQKTVEDHVFCCHCTIAFCGGCLRNRHGEDIEVEMKDDVQWTCPKCRGGCGPGCNNCCNCGPCRKAQGLEPTGLLVHKARACGFTNVHDYLIYQKTGECEEILERRKRGKGWCQTDPLSFHKKQKRSETDSGTEASCRKRLNFSPNASQSEGEKHVKSKEISNVKKLEFLPSVQALKSEEDEETPTSASKNTVRKDEMLDNLQALKSKEDAVKETVNLQLKPVNGKRIQDNLQSKVVSASEMGTLVQVKLEPEFCESSNKVTALLPGKVTDVHLLEHDVSVLQGVLLQDSAPCAPAEPNSYESVSNHKVAVKKEPPDLDLQFENGLSKSEEVPWGQESRACKSMAVLEHKERADEPVENRKYHAIEVRNESVCQITQVEAEILEQASQNSNSPSANFKGDKGVDQPVIGETRRDGDMTSPFPSNFQLYPGDSNFHLYPRTNFNLYPESSAPMPSIEREIIDGQRMRSPDYKVKLESVSSQEAQCNIDLSKNMAWRAPMDVSCSGHAKVDDFVPLATVKEEREDFWDLHSSAFPTKSSSLFGIVKVKSEREDVPFTIEPALQCPRFNDGRSEVKEETLNDATMSKLICIDDEEAQTLPMSFAGLGKSSCDSFGDVSHLWTVDDFRKKLEARLSEPFSRKELEMHTVAVNHRKPIYKARETRQGCSQFVSEEEGYSYLDHHPDLACRLEECVSPIFKLSLLRGFFFWLEHASMFGAFKPWTSASRVSDTQENDDCIEIDGPDCEILAVICSVD